MNKTSTAARSGSFGNDAVTESQKRCAKLLARVFCVYVNTKTLHWHMAGRHFHDYHILLDEHAEEIFEMTDDIAERARKLGGTTLRSIGDISRRFATTLWS